MPSEGDYLFLSSLFPCLLAVPSPRRVGENQRSKMAAEILSENFVSAKMVKVDYSECL